jgi:hypothetical protein
MKKKLIYASLPSGAAGLIFNPAYCDGSSRRFGISGAEAPALAMKFTGLKAGAPTPGGWRTLWFLRARMLNVVLP